VHIERAKQLVWLIEKCVQVRLPVVHAGIGRWDDAAYLDRIKSLLARHNLELMPAIAGDFVNTGDAAKKAIDGAIDTLRKYKDFGGVSISKYCTYPMIHTRFTTHPPLDEQVERITENSRPVVKAA